MSVGAFLDTYSYLTLDDIKSCAEYCAARRCITDSVLNYCQGCSLDNRKAESCLYPEDTTATIEKESSVREDMEEPVNGWEYAQKLYDMLK
jgi:hypothetical protein